MIWASSGPSPKTVCVASFHSGHARQESASSRSCASRAARATLLRGRAPAVSRVWQLTSCLSRLGPATPYVLAAAAVAGWWLGSARVRAFARSWRTHAWLLAAAVLAYLLALAPVLAAGRPTFSSFMA